MNGLIKYIIPKLDGKIVNQFAHKVACYYGCLLVRPNKVLNYDRAEDPQTMDVVMTKIGAESLEYPYKQSVAVQDFQYHVPTLFQNSPVK